MTDNFPNSAICLRPSQGHKSLQLPGMTSSFYPFTGATRKPGLSEIHSWKTLKLPSSLKPESFPLLVWKKPRGVKSEHLDRISSGHAFPGLPRSSTPAPLPDRCRARLLGNVVQRRAPTASPEPNPRLHHPAHLALCLSPRVSHNSSLYQILWEQMRNAPI